MNACFPRKLSFNYHGFSITGKDIKRIISFEVLRKCFMCYRDCALENEKRRVRKHMQRHIPLHDIYLEVMEFGPKTFAEGVFNSIVDIIKHYLGMFKLQVHSEEEVTMLIQKVLSEEIAKTYWMAFILDCQPYFSDRAKTPSPESNVVDSLEDTSRGSEKMIVYCAKLGWKSKEGRIVIPEEVVTNIW
jgi:hypothetical protein